MDIFLEQELFEQELNEAQLIELTELRLLGIVKRCGFCRYPRAEHCDWCDDTGWYYVPNRSGPICSLPEAIIRKYIFHSAK